MIESRRWRRLVAAATLLAACSSPAREPKLQVASAAPFATASHPSAATPSSSAASRPELAPLAWAGARVQFASVDAARAVLSERDGFVRALSAFDRSLRLATPDAVDEETFLVHAARQVVAWPDAGRERWHAAGVELQKALIGLELPLPPTLLLVTTTGREELGAPYTRGNAIVIPDKAVERAKAPLRLLAHELLHVATRHQPGLRDRLYAVLGYRRVESVPYPAQLEPRRLTNPDAFESTHAIEVEAGKRKFLVAPVLASKVGPAEAAASSLAGLFDLRLVEIGPRGLARKTGAGALVLHALDATDFQERSAINTDYAIHPEEVLADNFAKLIERRAGVKVEVARPEILDAIEAALAPREGTAR